MKGPLRHKFWYAGKAGLPSVTLDIHPGTIIAYVDKGQSIPAQSKEQAEEIGWYSLYHARDMFIENQTRYNVVIETDRTGEIITKPHAGLVMNLNGPFPMKDPVTSGLWIDKSRNKEVGPDQYELEGESDHPVLTKAEAGLMAAIEFKEKMPEMIRSALPESLQNFESQFGALNSNVHSILAQIQGGRPAESMLLQAVGLLSQMQEKMNKMDDEIRLIKRSSGKGQIKFNF